MHTCLSSRTEYVCLSEMRWFNMGSVGFSLCWKNAKWDRGILRRMQLPWVEGNGVGYAATSVFELKLQSTVENLTINLNTISFIQLNSSSGTWSREKIHGLPAYKWHSNCFERHQPLCCSGIHAVTRLLRSSYLTETKHNAQVIYRELRKKNISRSVAHSSITKNDK